jgi:hypothetical protein
LISGLDGVMFNDLMDNIEWFFNLHDKNKDGYLTKDEVLTLSESFLVCFMLSISDRMLMDLQFIFRHEIGDAYLGAVSRFMTNAFEYGDALLPHHNAPSGDVENGTAPVAHGVESNAPYLNLPT